MTGDFYFHKIQIKNKGFASPFDAPKTSPAVNNPTKANEPSICCQKCNQKALFFISQVDAHGVVKSKALCFAHAIESNIFHPKAWDLVYTPLPEPIKKPSKVKKPISKIAKVAKVSKSRELTCQCGMTQRLLKKKGLTGCEHCYTTFADFIKPALPQIQFAAIHAGKSPAKAPQRLDVRRHMQVLQLKMQFAIQQEAYEDAAACRDRIKELSELVETRG